MSLPVISLHTYRLTRMKMKSFQWFTFHHLYVFLTLWCFALLSIKGYIVICHYDILILEQNDRLD